MESDIIIYDMHTADLDELQDKAKLLKCSSYPTAKTLILISSVRVWGATKPKLVEMSPEELAELEDPESEKFKVQEYEDSEYMKRKASEDYKAWKGCETLAMSIGMNKADLDVYVLSAGIVYGNGERVLTHLFKSAWLENPEELPIIGDGKNHVPTIHVRDLARAVKHVIQIKPSSKYLFAVDSSPSQMQKDIIKAISDGVGTGKVKNIDLEGVKKKKWAIALSLDVKVKPSKIFLPPSEEEKEDEIEEEEGEEGEEGELKAKKPKPIRMEWHCLGGLITEIKKINIEFNENRGLKPITVFVTGPPGSGKTHAAKMLAKFYNVPHIHTSTVIQKAIQLQNEFGEALRTKLNELKDELLEEAENNKKEGEEINPDTIKPRLPKDLLAKAFRWALGQNPCRNRGYVLDGFPKSYDDAWNVFKMMPPKKTDDEDADEEPDRSKMITDFSIFPQSVIEFHGTDDELIEKVKKLPEDIIQGSHYNLIDMRRRLKEYRANNNNPMGMPSVLEFFNENSIEMLSLHCNDENSQDSCRIYMERFGKPVNYQTGDLVEEAKRIEANENAVEKEAEEEKERLRKCEELEVDKKIMRNDEIKKKIASAQQKEIDVLERMGEHVKGYMLENVYEVLSHGLTKVCMKKREDPIDYLAKYLFKHADGIPHPDPYLY